MQKKVLELLDVKKVYRMDSVEVNALSGITMDIKEGEFVAIVGASGSGKSTLLSIIGALDIPTEGSVLLDGTDITKLPESKIARIRGRKIGFVFQTFNLYPTLSVYENIALPMRIHEFPEKEIKEKVVELVGLVGLQNRASHLPAQLSGGERQRVSLARALSASPSMILADEPTGNLDTKASAGIMKMLQDLHAKFGRTIVLVTHDMALAKFAERIITLSDGMIISDKNNRRNWK